MKMDNLRQRREQLQSAELRLKQSILDHDKSIVVSIVKVPCMRDIDGEQSIGLQTKAMCSCH